MSVDVRWAGDAARVVRGTGEMVNDPSQGGDRWGGGQKRTSDCGWMANTCDGDWEWLSVQEERGVWEKLDWGTSHARAIHTVLLYPVLNAAEN